MEKAKRHIKHNLFLAAISGIILIFILSCTNPFAPKEVFYSNNNGLISNQKTVNGVFDNFRYAYLFKDTLVYGNLLAPDFVFSYHDYELGNVKTLNRQEDMVATSGLFQAAQSLDLFWNEIAISVSSPDPLKTDISRSFSLTIVFNPTDVVKIQGRVNLRLVREEIGKQWKISMWQDESNY